MTELLGLMVIGLAGLTWLQQSEIKKLRAAIFFDEEELIKEAQHLATVEKLSRVAVMKRLRENHVGLSLLMAKNIVDQVAPNPFENEK